MSLRLLRVEVLFSLSLVWIFASSGAMRHECAAQPVQYPDGVLMFVSDRAGSWDIYSVLPDGSGLFQLTSDAGMNSGASISSDGRRVAFNSDRSGNMEIWIMGVDGSNPVQLTRSQGRCSGAAWSPNGELIAFHSNRDGGGIHVMGADGSNVRRISPRGMPASSPAWSPDGSRIAFTVDRNHHSEIWVMGVDGSSITQLTDTPEGGNQHPNWSPNGRWIVFNSWRNDAESSSDIWIVTPDGNEQRRLTSGVGMEEYPKWSPDGERILFTVGNAALFTMRADGTDRRQVTGEHFFTAGDDWGRR